VVPVDRPGDLSIIRTPTHVTRNARLVSPVVHCASAQVVTSVLLLQDVISCQSWDSYTKSFVGHARPDLSFRQPFATSHAKVQELVEKEDVEPDKERWCRIAGDPGSVVSPKLDFEANNGC
jgi:hypothetical protein